MSSAAPVARKVVAETHTVAILPCTRTGGLRGREDCWIAEIFPILAQGEIVAGGGEVWRQSVGRQVVRTHSKPLRVLLPFRSKQRQQEKESEEEEG